MKLYELLKSNSFLTFYWSIGYMALAGFIDLLLANLELIDMPESVTVILGVFLATASKAIHNRRTR